MLKLYQAERRFPAAKLEPGLPLAEPWCSLLLPPVNPVERRQPFDKPRPRARLRRMKNWKTTLAGAVAAGLSFAASQCAEPSWAHQLLQALAALAVAALGFHAADKAPSAPPAVLSSRSTLLTMLALTLLLGGGCCYLRAKVCHTPASAAAAEATVVSVRAMTLFDSGQTIARTGARWGGQSTNAPGAAVFLSGVDQVSSSSNLNTLAGGIMTLLGKSLAP